MKTNHQYIAPKSGKARARRSRNHLPKILFFLTLAVAAALVIWLIWPFVTGMSANTSESTTTATTTANTAPSTTAVQTTPSQTPATLSSSERKTLLDVATEQVTGLLEAASGRFAVYYQNLQTGEIWQYNAEAPFVAASSIKLGINTYLYTKFASGEISPNEILKYDSRAYPTGDYESGTGTIQSQPNGTSYSVRETSGLSIRISDNCGTNMVIRRLGGIDAVNVYLNSISSVVDYRKSVSYTNYAGDANNGRHRTSATDLGLHAVNLYKLWMADKETYQPLIDDLSQTEFDFGIQKGIPAGIKVSHKIGTNGIYSAENDVGIVFADEPFVLCVMTEMGSAGTAHQIQAEVAEIFYNYISELN